MTRARTAPEFSRPLRVADLPEGGRVVRARARAEELAAIARRYGVRAVLRFAVEARVRPEGRGWRVSGVARARATQACVVTLEDVDEIIETRFERVLLPGVPAPDIADLRPDEEEDPPEPLGEWIDPADMAVEAAALALDPYPRREGAAFEGGGGAADDEVSRPFAALAGLREKLERDGDGDGGGGGGE